MQLLIYSGIILFPLQFLAISLFSSTYDISTLIFLSITFIYLVHINNEKDFKKIYLTLILFTIFYSFVFLIFQNSPTHRFLSSLIWIGLYVSFYLLKKKIYYDVNIAKNLFIFIILISAVHCWYELFFEIGIENFNSNIKSRPSSFFVEPSYAGLVYFASSLAFFNIFLVSKNIKYQFLNLMIFFFLFLTGISTLSMHLITFFICIIITAFVYSRNKVILVKLIIISLFAILFLMVIFLFTDFDLAFHILDRLKFGSILDTKSLSLLSWLRGLDQFLFVLKSQPITGMGPGSTGEFEFYSFSGNILFHRGVYDLTLKDSYSLFFRLGIEFGIIFLLITSIILLVQLFEVRKLIKKDIVLMTNSQIFIFFFSMTCIVGSFIKEPNFARATLCVSLFFYFTILEQRR